MNIKAIAWMVVASTAATSALRAQETNAFKDEKAKISYAIGLNIGENWKRQEIEVDFDELLRGLKDATAGGPTLLTPPEVREVLNKYRQELMAKQQAKRKELADKNKKVSDEFLAANKEKPGVQTMPDGLQYKILTEGSGESPEKNDTVMVNFQVTLVDGTHVEGTSTNGEPATMRVNGPLRGLTEALTHMKPGGKWEVYIPPDLAYGMYGRPPIVGPESALIYEIELVSVQKAKPPAPLTSDIIKVPSLEEMKKGAKIETIKAEDVEKMQQEQQEKAKEKQEQEKN